jgi:type III secretion protein C
MLKYFFPIFLLSFPLSSLPDQHFVNFSQVKISELIRYVSKIAKVNFIFDEKKINFEVDLISGKSLSDEELIESLLFLLKQNGCQVQEKNGTYFVEPIQSIAPVVEPIKETKKIKPKFQIVKLQYHQGSEILQALKDLCIHQSNIDQKLLTDIQSIQWMKSTNSLLISSDSETSEEIISLIQTVDIPQKQVFIEVLVVETNIKNGLEFGVNWSIGSKNHPEEKFPLVKGLDLSVIGDIILHKGFSFHSLSALVSALEQDKDTQIVLNQKIITQDNQNSKIFVGDTIPFAGSKTEITGSNMQTTSNIEYKDIGVSLSITPLIGEEDVITLDISEEITEATPNFFPDSHGIQGIQTTKTNMVTKAHVPDQHFLILTGMVRNKNSKEKSQIPCLGGIPWIGGLFGKRQTMQEKRHITIFVRPQIVKHVKQFKSYFDQELNRILPKDSLELQK